MIDVNAVLRPASVGNLTVAETPAGVDFLGPDLSANTYMLHIPAGYPTGTSPTLTGKIQESDDNSTWRDFLTFQVLAPGVGGEYFVTGKCDARYRRWTCALPGGTTPNYGPVVVALVPSGRNSSF